jgi:hypothetical protein
MPILRRRRRQETPAQKKAHHEYATARRWLDVIAAGLGKQIRHVYDREDLTAIEYIIKRDFWPAISEMELAEARWQNSRKSRKKVTAQ